ncbi:MAG: 16S rRNA (cytidine(1402)-2'-O)-methyltransferase [Alphaproteobacteria bacterium]
MASDKKPLSGDMKAARPALTPGLYLVATPIGNLRDITLRAIDILGDVDLIACEDTRVTGRLLAHYGIATQKTPYHDFSDEAARRRLLDVLDSGRSVALVSDAGSPLIADPGYKLVRDAAAAGHAIYPVPGPSALIAGLQASGLPTDRVLFLGFPPSKKQARCAFFESVATVQATLIFYESPKRIEGTVSDMAAVLGPDRPSSIAREITKLHEEHRRGSLADLSASLPGMAKKGELVVIVGPPSTETPPLEPADIDRLLLAALQEGGVKQAAASVARETGRPKRDLYARAVALKSDARDRSDNDG